MNFKFLKRDYIKTLEYSFIISLTFIIALFFFSQRQTGLKQATDDYITPDIMIIHIPITVQKTQILPKPLRPVIPVAADELEILDEVAIEKKTNEPAFGNSEGFIGGEVNPSMTPRQIVEVIPDLDDESKGVIILSLQIGVDGKIVHYKVVRNTTNSAYCLQEVVSAARRSKWQPAILNGKPVEFWIKKTYKIN